ncbi:NYN domain protein [compost metagenome]
MTEQVVKPQRVRIFVDFWNFSLSLRRVDENHKIDWKKVAPVLTAEAAQLVGGPSPCAYEAMHVFGSYDPAKANDVKFKNWYTNWLDKLPGVHVELLERQKKKNFSKCPHCQGEHTECVHCKSDPRGTEEKGVDTRIGTEMISLAWSNGYEIAVLASADRDFVPVADFLQTKGIKVIHAAFPPNGNQLSQRCWGNFDVVKVMNQFAMPPAAPKT